MATKAKKKSTATGRWSVSVNNVNMGSFPAIAGLEGAATWQNGVLASGGVHACATS